MAVYKIDDVIILLLRQILLLLLLAILLQTVLNMFSDYTERLGFLIMQLFSPTNVKTNLHESNKSHIISVKKAVLLVNNDNLQISPSVRKEFVRDFLHDEKLSMRSKPNRITREKKIILPNENQLNNFKMIKNKRISFNSTLQTKVYRRTSI